MIKQVLYLILFITIVSGCATTPKGMPDNPLSTGQLEAAFQAYREGRLGDAEALLLGVLDKHPTLSEAWFKLANVYYRTGRHDAAVRAYEKTVAYDTKNGRAWYNLALTRIQQADAALLAGETQVKDNTQYYTMIRGLRTRLQSSSSAK